MPLFLPRAILTTDIALLSLAFCSAMSRYVVRMHNAISLGLANYLIVIAAVLNHNGLNMSSC